MSDRIPAEIWIGGKVAASLVPDLCAAIIDEGVCLEWGGPRVDPTGPDDLIAAIKANHQGVRLLWFCDEEASCGEFDVLESFLQAHDDPVHSADRWPLRIRSGEGGVPARSWASGSRRRSIG